MTEGKAIHPDSASDDAEVNVALTVLRVIRGWTQDNVAKESGIPNSSVSDYERGKKTPSLKTLARLTAAMGFSIHSIQRTQRFIQAMRSENLLSDDVSPEWQAPQDQVDSPLGSAPAALRWEIDQLAGEAGRVVSRLIRTHLVLLSRRALSESSSDAGAVESVNNASALTERPES